MREYFNSGVVSEKWFVMLIAEYIVHKAPPWLASSEKKIKLVWLSEKAFSSIPLFNKMRNIVLNQPKYSFLWRRNLRSII